MILRAQREQKPESYPISGPFRQITGKPETGDGVLSEAAIRAVLGLLADCGLRLYERESNGGQELFLVAPAEALIPISRVPDLLLLARPRLRWPRRLPGNPKIGRLARLRPPNDEVGPDTPQSYLPKRIKKRR